MQLTRKHNCTGHNGALYAVAPGRTARQFLTAGGDGWLVEWDLDDPETGQLVASVETQVFALCQVPETNWLVAGNMNGGVHWIDRDQPERNRNIQHHAKGVYDIQTLSGEVFTAGGDGVLTRWDAREARSVESFQLSNQSLRCIAAAPLRQMMAVGASDHSIYLLNAGTMELLQHIPKAHNNSVFSLCFSPDGRYLLSGGRDAMLRIRDMDDGFRLVQEMPAHWYTINHIVYAPDGRHFATASRDKTIRIWRAGDFSLVRSLDTIRDGCHVHSVNRLLWWEDNLVSVSDDRTAIIWAVDEDTPTPPIA
jgi:WD40 repeat protein